MPASSSRRARLGILGGTFDPVHLGHLLIADDVRRRLRLDRVVFVPSFSPPHRDRPVAGYGQRVEMVKRAIAGWPGLECSEVEASLPAPSYTVQTLEELGRGCGRTSLYLLLGADQYREVGRWHAPKDLARLARLVVMSRPGAGLPRLFPGHARRRVIMLDVIPVSIAAADIRTRLANGDSVQYMLPKGIPDYVRQQMLYSRAA